MLEALGAVAVFGLLRLIIEPHRVRITPGVSQFWLNWPTDDPRAIVALLTGLVALFYVLRGLYLTWTEWLKESTVAKSAGVRRQVQTAMYASMKCGKSRKRKNSRNPASSGAGGVCPLRSASLSSVAGRTEPSR